MTPEEREARKREQNRASHARRLARQAEEAQRAASSPRLTADIGKAALIRLPSGKAILPSEVPSWKS